MSAVKRIWSIIQVEFRHLFRERAAVVTVLLVPIVELLLFANAVSFDVRNVPTILIDQDHTANSQAYLQVYQVSDFFRVVNQESTSLDAVDQAFELNEARVAVVVPSGFGDKLASGTPAEVTVLIDGSEPNTARYASAYATALTQSYQAQLSTMWADRQGLGAQGTAQLEPRVRTWYNPQEQSALYLIPGLLVAIVMIVAIQQTAVSLVREKERHTQEQLTLSPLRSWELVIGKLSPWAALASLQMAAIALIGIALFGVPIRGDLTVELVAALFFLMCCLGLGLLVSAVSPSVDSANIAALMISFFPAFLLSGFAFPLADIPLALQYVSMLFPARYMVDVSRGVFLRGAGWAESQQSVAALAAYAVVALTLASILYARKLRS